MNVNVEEQLAKLDEKLKKLQKTEKDKYDFQVFRRYYEQFISIPSIINWSKMVPFNAERLMENFEDLPKFNDDEAKEILSHVAVIKLNGGLGTTMGCSGPKSLITVRDGKTFLDFAIEQNELLNKRYNSNVPLYLMDSFRTEETTKEWLIKKGLQDKVHQFTQSKCPRIYESNLLPVGDLPDEGFYPPGHGNVFESLNACGLLDQLIKEGRDVILCQMWTIRRLVLMFELLVLFVEKMWIMLWKLRKRLSKTLRKGGTLIEYENCIKHLELPHVPADKVDEFCSVRTFKTFNTNNIWVDLKAVKQKLPTMKLEVLPNKKKLTTGEPIIQLESAIGGAIKNFERVRVVSVHRSRFLPVKKAQDLLVVMGNAFIIDSDSGILRLNPKRQLPSAPIVHLSSVYEHVDSFLQHFPYIPDMLELETLTVNGNVHFGQNIKLKGNVIIEGDGEIPDGTLIEGKYKLT